MRRHLALAFACALVSASILGCAGRQPMGPKGPVVVDPELTNVLEALSRPQPESQDNVIVGLTSTTPSYLVAFDLDTGKERWRQKIEARSAPMLTQDAVALQTKGGKIAVFALDSGEQWLDRHVSGDFVGASGNREQLVISLENKSKASVRSLVLGFEKDSLKWTREMENTVGVPALSGSLAVVPWAGRRVSVLDMATGEERLRFYAPSRVTQALAENGKLYLSADELYRIAPGIDAEPHDKGLALIPVQRQLPGSPSLARNNLGPAPTPTDASFRVRLAWRGTSQDADLGFENDLLYFVYFRFVFAFSASEERWLWAYSHGKDIAGVGAGVDALTLVDMSGAVTTLSAKDGRALPGPTLGENLQMALVSVHSTHIPPESGGEAVSLEEGLLRIAQDTDTRLVEGRALAVRGLGSFSNENTTQTLVAFCQDKKLPATVKNAACEELGKGHRQGAKIVRKALAQRAGFLLSTDAPPAGSLGAFAASQKLSGVLPDLLAHLFSPATPPEELPGILRALAVLGNSATAEEVAKFFLLYHAEPAESPLSPALGEAARTLVALKKEQSRPLLEDALNGPFTSEPLKEHIRAALVPVTPPSKSDQESAQPQTAAVTADTPKDARPERLSDKHISAALRPILPKLKKCLSQSETTVRIVMMIDGKGKLVTQASTPPDAGSCLDPLLKGVTFPESKLQDTQRVVYLLNK